MNEVKLKPCPFCGSRVAPTIMDQNEAMWNDPDPDYDVIHIVVCCAARKGGCGASTGLCENDEKAVLAWNQRTHESPSEIAANGSKTNEERTFDKLQAEIRKRLTDDLKRF